MSKPCFNVRKNNCVSGRNLLAARVYDGCVQCQRISWFGDSLQFDHQVNILHFQPRAGSKAIPGRGDGGGGYKQRAFVKPPATTVHLCTCCFHCVVVHGRSQEFHPIVRHRQKRMNGAQQIVDATGSTTHSIADDVLAFK